jgi:tetratricopeptide (TPR) repeat protein
MRIGSPFRWTGNRRRPYAGLGTLLAQQGQTKKAIECLQQAIRLDPNGADHYFNLGNVVLGMGRLDEAISLFDVAVKADRHSRPEYHNNLGIAHRQKGNLELAIAWYGHAVSLKPDYVDALSNLGEALWQKGGEREGDWILPAGADAAAGVSRRTGESGRGAGGGGEMGGGDQRISRGDYDSTGLSAGA